MNNTDNRNAAAYSALISTLVIGVCAVWGGWARRWISDDGLIVLRTVRNLIAGNGPVFNKGERVEANTSTLWQYLIYAGERITGVSVERVAMVEALALSAFALALGVYATSRIYRTSIVVPAGALIYLALSPARDFFTSGLEWGLSIFYLAGLWALLVWWARDGKYAPYALAFWAGLSWLVRPELALYGGVAGIVLLATHRSWRQWLGILGAALPLPLGYQIFRMGYYGLLTPHTAVAKSAADAAWGKGLTYFGDFVGPYWLWLPMLLVLAAGIIALRPHLRGRTLAAVGVMVGCGLLHIVYVLRVGGDFMHGRMLLLPLFALLLPVFVLPLGVRRGGREDSAADAADAAGADGIGTRPAWLSAGVEALLVAAAAAGIAVWALVIAVRGHQVDWAMFDEGLTIVDEREFWTHATMREKGDPPKSTADFAHNDLIANFRNGIRGLEGGDALSIIYTSSTDPVTDVKTYDWLTVPRVTGRTDPATVYLLNMGMTSMNSPLDVRVLDNIGLATPIAARQPRIEGGRIGHDKMLPLEWQAADSAADIDDLPPWYDHEETRLCREALQTETFQELFATYRDPLTWDRFVDNIAWSLTKGRTLQLSSDPRDYLDK